MLLVKPAKLGFAERRARAACFKPDGLFVALSLFLLLPSLPFFKHEEGARSSASPPTPCSARMQACCDPAVQGAPGCSSCAHGRVTFTAASTEHPLSPASLPFLRKDLALPIHRQTLPRGWISSSLAASPLASGTAHRQSVLRAKVTFPERPRRAQTPYPVAALPGPAWSIPSCCHPASFPALGRTQPTLGAHRLPCPPLTCCPLCRDGWRLPAPLALTALPCSLPACSQHRAKRAPGSLPPVS